MRQLLFLVFIGLLNFPALSQRAYLIHTDANVSRLKEQIEKNEEVRSAWEDMVQKAKSHLNKGRNSVYDIRELALAYRMTGNEKYAGKIKEIILREIQKETWEDYALLQREPAWNAGLGTAHTTLNITLGYDCIYEYLTKEERRKIAEGIVRLGIRPTMNDWINPNSNIHTFDTMGHNWWSGTVDVAGLASLAVRAEIPEARDWVVKISEASVEWVNYSGSVLQNKIPTFDKEGGFWESINYANFGLSQYLLFRLAHKNVLPDEEMPEIEMLESMGDFFVYTTYYTSEGPMSVNFGDGSIHVNGHASVKLLWNLGYTKDLFAWYLQRTKKGDNREWMTLESAMGLILNPDLEGIAERYIPQQPNSKLYPDMDWATMRDSWEKDATMLAVKSGFAWNHAHADAGSYILFHNGKNLIIDSGNSSYGHPLYTKYYCQSVAHNVILFNGQGEPERSQYFGSINKGGLHHLIEKGDFRYLLADATGPYSQILERNYRSFLWIGDVILVIDDLLAKEPGQFEWLLHYNGESKRRGQKLSIKQGDAEIAVRPLFPNTFPDGGLPHDFPENMRLEEKMGYKDHKPETQIPYWSISHFKKTARTKFVTAITLKTEENKDDLPVIERFKGNDFIGVRITQNGETTEVYFNLLADGRIKHRNSIINMNGWDTDAYLTALTFDEGADRTKPENIKRLFIGHGSYLRKDGNPVIHALSKFFAIVDFDDNNREVEFEGQKPVRINFQFEEVPDEVKINGKEYEPLFDKGKNIGLINLN